MTWKTPFPYLAIGGFAVMALAILISSQPQPPHWKHQCVKSHDDTFMVMQTSPGGNGAPGGAYPAYQVISVCDQYKAVCVKDPRWTKTPNVCKGEKR